MIFSGSWDLGWKKQTTAQAIFWAFHLWMKASKLATILIENDIKSRRFQANNHGLLNPAQTGSYTETTRIRNKMAWHPTQDMSFQTASILDNNTMQVGGDNLVPNPSDLKDCVFMCLSMLFNMIYQPYERHRVVMRQSNTFWPMNACVIGSSSFASVSSFSTYYWLWMIMWYTPFSETPKYHTLHAQTHTTTHHHIHTFTFFFYLAICVYNCIHTLHYITLHYIAVHYISFTLYLSLVTPSHFQVAFTDGHTSQYKVEALVKDDLP